MLSEVARRVHVVGWEVELRPGRATPVKKAVAMLKVFYLTRKVIDSCRKLGARIKVPVWDEEGHEAETTFSKNPQRSFVWL